MGEGEGEMHGNRRTFKLANPVIPSKLFVTDKRRSGPHPDLASLNVLILLCCVHMLGDRVTGDEPPGASGGFEQFL